MSWRFYPLEGFVHAGLLIKDGKAVPAQFLTPEEAKARRPRQIEKKDAA